MDEYERLYEATVPSVVSVYRDAGGRGAGSGFVYDDDHLLTNEHVVRDRRRVDVIIGIGGRPVRSHEELTRRLLTDAVPGAAVRLTVLRDGRERTLEVVPAERPVSDDDRRRAGGAGNGTTIPVE